jgi:AhpD family alkylhydroperoxidase
MNEQPRLPARAVPQKSLQALITFASAAAPGIDPRLRQLINLRISQINGCGFCIDMHSAALAKLAVPARELYALAGWREAHRFFSAPERAALAWIESVNAIPQRSPDDAEFQDMRKHFEDSQIAEITFAVGAIRAFNMLNVSFHTPVPEVPYVHAE